MDEYISKESAISIFEAKAEMAVCTPAQSYFHKAAKMIELLPAADVAPVRHGRWIYAKTYYDADECNCSLCGQLMTTAINKRMNFCPNCGAKMDGGVDDG